MNTTIENLRRDRERLQTQKESLEQENIRLHGRTVDEITRELQRRKEVLQGEIAGITSQIAAAREQLAQVNQEIEQRRAVYRSEIAQHTAAKNGIQIEHQRFADKIAALRATPEGHFEFTVKTLEQTIQQLKNDLGVEFRARNNALSENRSLQAGRKYDVLLGVVAGGIVTALIMNGGIRL